MLYEREHLQQARDMPTVRTIQTLYSQSCYERYSLADKGAQ